MTDLLAWLIPALPLCTAVLTQVVRRTATADRISVGGSLLTAAAAAALCARALLESARPITGSWYLVNGATGVFIAVIAAVGLMSAFAAPVYLAHSGRSFFRAQRSRAWFYLAFHLFWAAVLALPLSNNLAVSWLLVESTTAASALLVGFTGRRSALEAGWKYLVLTTCGLAIAMLGILILYVGVAPHGAGLHALDWQHIHTHAASLKTSSATLAVILIAVGFAAKIGWAPVHNWLPDAHSEAPPPVSALLSAALLPTVILIVWRTVQAVAPALSGELGQTLFLGFGLASLAVSVPFLWRPLPWKRLLAYSSLEHMGVIALGIGFGSPLAIAGVILHLAGHALAKALGFYAAVPLQRHQAESAAEPASGLMQKSHGVAIAAGLSLGALSGLPPSPLFFSELLIFLGGLQSGHLVVTALAATLVACGFLGLMHAAIEALAGESEHEHRWQRGRSVRLAERCAVAVGAGLLLLSAVAFLLPTWSVTGAMAGHL